MLNIKKKYFQKHSFELTRRRQHFEILVSNRDKLGQLCLILSRLTENYLLQNLTYQIWSIWLRFGAVGQVELNLKYKTTWWRVNLWARACASSFATLFEVHISIRAIIIQAACDFNCNTFSCFIFFFFCYIWPKMNSSSTGLGVVGFSCMPIQHHQVRRGDFVVPWLNISFLDSEKARGSALQCIEINLLLKTNSGKIQSKQKCLKI